MSKYCSQFIGNAYLTIDGGILTSIKAKDAVDFV